MFNFGLSYTDWRKIVWTFIQAAAAVLIALASDWIKEGGELNWKVWAIAAVAAGWSAVKNFVLAEEAPIK